MSFIVLRHGESVWNKENKFTGWVDIGLSEKGEQEALIAGDKLIAIEMKRLKGGTVSPAQKIWIAKLNSAGIDARVCKGSKNAIDFIESVIS